MLIKMNSSRKTAAGTFRLGRVYSFDPKTDRGHAVLEALKPHLESKVAVKVTEDEAKEARLEMVRLEAPTGDGEAEAQAKAATDAEKSGGKGGQK